MEEQILQEEVQQAPYVPRPKWQVWLARVALVIFIIGVILYYLNIFGAAK